MRPIAQVPPSSALAGPAYRALMAAAALRLTGQTDRSSSALRRALWTTALGRIAPEEREWIARIEGRRDELASSEISPFARWASVAPVWGRFLMRTVRESNPQSCLELGTGFGISAAYQAAALELNKGGLLTTLERQEGLGSIAQEGLTGLGLDQRVELRIVSPDDRLGDVLAGVGPISYAFLDADHTIEGTVAHFQELQPHLDDGAIVVVDDINWTDEMKRAWSAICGDPSVSLALRLRRMGIMVIARRGVGARAAPMKPRESDRTGKAAGHRLGVLKKARGLVTLRALSVTAGFLYSPAGVRLGMAVSLPRLARRRDPGSRALAAAARSIARNRIPPEEGEWATRIEARRSELAGREERAQPFEQGLPDTVDAASAWTTIPPAWGMFLMRLVRELRPRSCLELGTGIGISTNYEAAALELNGGGRLITLDGSAEWAAIAEEGLSRLGLGGVEFSVGPIDETLPGAAERSAPVDYAFVDAEHTEEATVGYFEGIAPHMAPHGVMVFDDIPWSRELRRTWRRIARDHRVAASFALGRMGVVVISGNST